jgi:NADH-quinone oxidoreductase subunit N
VNNEIISALVNAYPLVVPEAILVLGACVLFVGATFRPDRHLWGAVTLAFLAAAGVALWFSPLSPHQGEAGRAALFAAPVYLDRLALWVKALALAGAAVLVLCSWDEVGDRFAAEYHACLLVITAGMCLVGSANELITLFLALEMVSIPTYVLLYLPRSGTPAQEAAMKYFLLSVFSSALLLFGFSYLYGMGGTTNLTALAGGLDRTPATGLPGVGLVALVMVVAGLGFRVAAVPFHFYAPDVYQGAPTAAAALLAFVPKVAGFVALLHLLGFVPHEGTAAAQVLATQGPPMVLGPQVPHVLWILAMVTMTLGNVLALLQDNVKRMLAYSSVAHAGYVLIGFVVARYPTTAGASGVEAVLFYLVAYGAMTIGAFAVLVYLSTPGRQVQKVDDLAGLAQSHPAAALFMGLFLFSLIGIPWTAGFVGKFLLFAGALAVQPEGTPPLLFRLLAVVGVLNAAIGAWYYLRVVTVMFLRAPLHPPERPRPSPVLAALAVCAIVTVAAGVYPKVLLAPVQWALPSTAPEAAAVP